MSQTVRHGFTSIEAPLYFLKKYWPTRRIIEHGRIKAYLLRSKDWYSLEAMLDRNPLLYHRTTKNRPVLCDNDSLEEFCKENGWRITL